MVVLKMQQETIITLIKAIIVVQCRSSSIRNTRMKCYSASGHTMPLNTMSKMLRDVMSRSHGERPLLINQIVSFSIFFQKRQTEFVTSFKSCILPVLLISWRPCNVQCFGPLKRIARMRSRHPSSFRVYIKFLMIIIKIMCLRRLLKIDILDFFVKCAPF